MDPVRQAQHQGRWRFPRARRLLIPPNGIPLCRWLDTQATSLKGLVVNVGAGQDERHYGRRVIRVDAFAPHCTVRADLKHALPFADAVFDAAVCTEVLEHVPDSRLLIAELARVLKPGGRAVVTTPFVFQFHPDPEDYVRFTPTGLGTELRRAGFELELVAGIGNGLMAFALLLESIHPAMKIVVRLLVLLLRPAIRGGAPRDGKWSAWAAHSVALARKSEVRAESHDLRP